MDEAPTIDELQSDVRAYRDARLWRLTSATGWLALVNKSWLAEGTSTVGGAPDCNIVIPGAPLRLGSLTRTGQEVRFDAAPDVSARARGQLIQSLVMRSDAEPSPDQIQVGSLRLELIRRGNDLALRVRDLESPTLKGFPGIPCYDVDLKWRVVARYEARTEPLAVDIADSDGRPQRYASPGTALFEVDGKPCRLQLFTENDGRRLFVLFSDTTNGRETYGAGRFLYAPLPDDGQVVLDFNKAFNPPCAFTPFASCPVPPAANRLDLAVTAGEKRPHD
jgi:hypothetical protein